MQLAGRQAHKPLQLGHTSHGFRQQHVALADHQNLSCAERGSRVKHISTVSYKLWPRQMANMPSKPHACNPEAGRAGQTSKLIMSLQESQSAARWLPFLPHRTWHNTAQHSISVVKFTNHNATHTCRRRSGRSAASILPETSGPRSSFASRLPPMCSMRSRLRAASSAGTCRGGRTAGQGGEVCCERGGRFNYRQRPATQGSH